MNLFAIENTVNTILNEQNLSGFVKVRDAETVKVYSGPDADFDYEGTVKITQDFEQFILNVIKKVSGR